MTAYPPGGLLREFLGALPQLRGPVALAGIARTAAPRAPLPPVCEWAEAHFWIPERNGSIVLAPYQRAVLRESQRRDADGNLVYSTVVWSDIKKSAKSTVAALVAAHTALSTDYGSVYVVANDLKQASSRVGEYLTRAIPHDAGMRERMKYTPSRNVVTVEDTHSSIEFIPIDPSGEAGSGADLIVFSELWGAHEQAQRRMWAEMTLSPLKFGKSQRWVETYAGYQGESELLYSLYDQGVLHGRRLTLPGAPDGLEVYASDAARMLVLWNTVPRLPWQTRAYYEQEAAALASQPGAFDRMHRNQWVSSTEAFVDLAVWDARRGEIPPLDASTPIVLGVDAAEKGDCFSIVATSRVPGRDKTIAVRYCRNWTPPPGGRISFRGTPDAPGPIAMLEWLIEHHNVVCLAYDPTKLELAAQDLAGKAWMYEFSQAGEREVGDKLLRDLILQGRLYHSGEPELREHVGNANAQAAGRDKEHIRIVKKGSGHIDACVALSMSAKKNLELNL